MTAYPDLIVGPMDPDSTSELTRKLGTHNKVDRLLKRHAANYPLALTKALARPRDEDRTEALDVDEVHDYCLGLRGKSAFLGDDDEIVSASVRGTRDADRVVSVLYRTGKSGRSARAVVPYDEMKGSQEAYERLLAERDGEAAPPVSRDEAVVEAERARQAAEQEAAELREQLERLQDPEPFEGYDDLKAEEVVARVKEGGRAAFGESGLQRVIEYENAHKKRSTVVNAAEDAITAA